MLPREPEVEAEKGPGRGVENRNHPPMMVVGISIDRRGSELVSPDSERMFNGWAAASGEKRFDFSAGVAWFGAILR